MFWRRKPTYVEWDLVRDEAGAFGGDIYPSAAPMVIVHQIDPVHSSYEDIAAAVQQWVASMPEKYRLNAQFEEFKAIAWKLDNDEFTEES